MRIMLCCAGSFSTTMLMENIKRMVKDSDKLNEEEFNFIAIPAEAIESKIDNYDVVLVGPQITHKLEYIESVTKPRGIPCILIDKDIYGAMDGGTVLKMALVEYHKSLKAKDIK